MQKSWKVQTSQKFEDTTHLLHLLVLFITSGDTSASQPKQKNIIYGSQ